MKAALKDQAGVALGRQTRQSEDKRRKVDVFMGKHRAQGSIAAIMTAGPEACIEDRVSINAMIEQVELRIVRR
ncbi:hypothetical protein [Brevundimonas nasdae]|uniref:hypothetical protein n=1 Tax=Brevundimonas nasdae TaxID=172043 RepID=UPI003F68E24C